jgi:hypothetical protein
VLACADAVGWRRWEPVGCAGGSEDVMGVEEIYVYRMRGGRLAGAAGVEDNVARMRQLNTFRRQGGRNEAAARESRSPWLAG